MDRPRTADGAWASRSRTRVIISSRIETRGTKTHLWRPDTGINAVAKMARLLPALETMAFGHTPAKLAGGTPPRTTILRFSGGVPREMQFTPDICRVVLASSGSCGHDGRQRHGGHRGGAGRRR